MLFWPLLAPCYTAWAFYSWAAVYGLRPMRQQAPQIRANVIYLSEYRRAIKRTLPPR